MPHKHWRCGSDDTERRRWQDPEAILDGIGLQPGMVFADIGCGEGFFTLPAAKAVGGEGRVYALDVDDEAIGRLKETARRRGLKNITAIFGEGETTVPCERCADIVFLGIVLHDFSDAAKVLANARKIIKPGGLLANLDWKKEEMEIGPPKEIRFDEEKASELISAAGFEVTAVKESGSFHYLITAKPA